jgi:hypothetical protein
MAKPVSAKNLSPSAFTRNLTNPASCSLKLTAWLYRTSYSKERLFMKKITSYLIIMSILFMLFFGCHGGSNTSNSVAASINESPVADAGEDQSVAFGESALLSGSGS